VLDALRAEGVEIVEGAAVERVRGRARARSRSQVKGGTVFPGTHLLVAVGRKPNLDRLDLDAAGIAHSAGHQGRCRLRTSNRRVYAIGDVAGQGQFTHLAGYHAGVVIRSILFGLPARARADHIPRVTYTDPELAQVGLTEAEARAAHGAALQVIRLGFDANDRALAEGRTEGFIKLMVVRGRPGGRHHRRAAGGRADRALGAGHGQPAEAERRLPARCCPIRRWRNCQQTRGRSLFFPKLFDNPWVKRVVGLVQRCCPDGAGQARACSRIRFQAGSCC
jgi:hypothetical protein